MEDILLFFCFFFQAEDGIRDLTVTGVQTCALPISVCLADAGQRSRGAVYQDCAGRDPSADFELWPWSEARAGGSRGRIFHRHGPLHRARAAVGKAGNVDNLAGHPESREACLVLHCHSRCCNVGPSTHAGPRGPNVRAAGGGIHPLVWSVFRYPTLHDGAEVGVHGTAQGSRPLACRDLPDGRGKSSEAPDPTSRWKALRTGLLICREPDLDASPRFVPLSSSGPSVRYAFACRG